MTLDMTTAARALGWSRRSLQEFIKNTPTDKAGTPFYYPNGNRKLFTERDIERISAYRREEERCRLSSSRRARASRRSTTAAAPTSESLLIEAQRLTGRPLLAKSSGNVVSFRK